MGTQQRNLKIVFHDIQPEALYDSIVRGAGWSGGERALSSSAVGEEIFQSAARLQYPSYSYEEIHNIHRQMSRGMELKSGQGPAVSSVFHLLVRMGQRALRQTEDRVVCRFSEMMAWRNVSLDLGQDLFTTAFLAYEDMLYGQPIRPELAWDAAIRTDNHRLHTLLRGGLAENHCHLGGTTQAFPLSWACLMNYPEAIPLAEKALERNLHPQLSRGPADNVWSWQKRLLWAQHLRLELFNQLEGGCGNIEMDLEWIFYAVRQVRSRLETARFCFGARVPQPGAPPVVLDYALRRQDCANGLLKRHNRLLSGERSFLYRCFRACFDGTFSPEMQDWFYLYLLIKENFRSEIVQTNSQAGFYNFMKYQNRKDAVYDKIPGYHAESLRLAVNANQSSQGITSFELRVAPRDTPEELRLQLENNERLIRYAGGLRPEERHFFVYHFIKTPDPEGDRRLLERPRNQKTRQSCRRQAQALAQELLHDRWFCDRVFGIDAANLEIGCRPETFATEFRYLRGITPMQDHGAFLDRSTSPHLYATYHAGEDYLDIADGLRAIDEAVRFLELRRGDRIAHALALGVAPEVHYDYKRRHIILPKQDFLDNVIWLLFRSEELGIAMEPQLRSRLESLADRLFLDIYGDILPANRYQYYCSMQLRGDNPELYFHYTLPYRLPERITDTLRGRYDAYRVQTSSELAAFRSSPQILQLCQCYHYDRVCRERGQELYEYKVDECYLLLIRQMQDSMARHYAGLGLMIECNPTSNYLIGTFQRYDRHPIFRFNNACLIPVDGSFEATPQLSVSVNTDDLGVFDTTLENEYAILASCLERMPAKDGARRYTNDSIYRYLDNLRKMGLEQSFYLRTVPERERLEQPRQRRFRLAARRG